MAVSRLYVLKRVGEEDGTREHRWRDGEEKGYPTLVFRYRHLQKMIAENARGTKKKWASVYLSLAAV